MKKSKNVKICRPDAACLCGTVLHETGWSTGFHNADHQHQKTV